MVPRFPVSVERKFYFRARISNGEILETDSFKSLYRFALINLRGETPRNSTEHSFNFAWFEFGFDTWYTDHDGKFYSEFTTLRRYGMMWVSNYSQGFRRCEDDKEIRIERVR